MEDKLLPNLPSSESLVSFSLATLLSEGVLPQLVCIVGNDEEVIYAEVSIVPSFLTNPEVLLVSMKSLSLVKSLIFDGIVGLLDRSLYDPLNVLYVLVSIEPSFFTSPEVLLLLILLLNAVSMLPLMLACVSLALDPILLCAVPSLT